MYAWKQSPSQKNKTLLYYYDLWIQRFSIYIIVWSHSMAYIYRAVFFIKLLWIWIYDPYSYAYKYSKQLSSFIFQRRTLDGNTVLSVFHSTPKSKSAFCVSTGVSIRCDAAFPLTCSLSLPHNPVTWYIKDLVL